MPHTNERTPTIRRFVRARARLALGALAGALALAAPATAPAAVRHAAPDGATSGSCVAADPCRLDQAVSAATAGDEVIVAPGEYSLAPGLSAEGIDLHGAYGRPRPTLVADSTAWSAANPLAHGPPPALDLEGGSVTHLVVEAIGAGQEGVEIEGSLAADLIVVSRSSTAIGAKGVPTGTVLRNSFAQSSGSGAEAVSVKDSKDGAGPVEIRHVTAIASGPGSAGLQSKSVLGVATVRNVIARGTSEDLDASHYGANLHASHSSFRPEKSVNVTDDGGNQSEAPLFADSGAGNFRLVAGSPAIDAGIVDPLAGLTDLEGRDRVIGLAPDLGAYEFDPSGAPAPGGPPPSLADGVLPPVGQLPAPTPPVLGEDMRLGPASGRVLVSLPGRRPVALRRESSVPMGSVVDTRKGAVRLQTVRDASGRTQAGTFAGGVFRVSQRRGRAPTTDLRLLGGDYRGCSARRASQPTASASWVRRRSIRRLWGRDRGGRFRTIGRYGAATVRGTSWLTSDTCRGTLIAVRQGAVVARDFKRRRNVLVRAGRSYLARRVR